MKTHDLPIRYTDDPAESEAKHERHIMAALWISLALLLALSLALVLAEGNGLFESSPNGPLPPLPYSF
jgi:hypothetical protein